MNKVFSTLLLIFLLAVLLAFLIVENSDFPSHVKEGIAKCGNLNDVKYIRDTNVVATITCKNGNSFTIINGENK
jgi:hypothetical protein